MIDHLETCKSTRQIAAKTFYKSLSNLFNKSTLSESILRDGWLNELRKEKEIYSEGWYIPPPHGIGILFGTLDDTQRLNFPTLREEKYWPQENIFLDKNEGVLTVYCSPVNKKLCTIGDFGLTIYLGKDKKMQNHLKKVLNFNKQIFKEIKIGMELRDVYYYACNLFKANGYTNNGWISINDPTTINIGHTIPQMNSNRRKDKISKSRKFLNEIETTKILPGTAFTLEARLKDLNNSKLPTVYFHTIVLISDKNNKILLTDFDQIFKLTQMEYML